MNASTRLARKPFGRQAGQPTSALTGWLISPAKRLRNGRSGPTNWADNFWRRHWLRPSKAGLYNPQTRAFSLARTPPGDQPNPRAWFALQLIPFALWAPWARGQPASQPASRPAATIARVIHQSDALGLISVHARWLERRRRSHLGPADQEQNNFFSSRFCFFGRLHICAAFALPPAAHQLRPIGRGGQRAGRQADGRMDRRTREHARTISGGGDVRAPWRAGGPNSRRMIDARQSEAGACIIVARGCGRRVCKQDGRAIDAKHKQQVVSLSFSLCLSCKPGRNPLWPI